MEVEFSLADKFKRQSFTRGEWKISEEERVTGEGVFVSRPLRGKTLFANLN